MPDRPRSHRDISALWNERRKTRDVEIASMNEVQMAIDGEVAPAYKDLFTEKDIHIKLQTTRSAYDSLRRNLSDIPILPHVPHRGKRDSATARGKEELVEKVMVGYHNGASALPGPSFRTIIKRLADFQAKFFDATMLINYDIDRKLIYFEPKDPRCHFPPTGWTPWSMQPLDGTLLVYETTLGEIKQRFAYDSYGDAKPDVLQRLNNAYKPTYGFGGNAKVDDSQIVQVGAYRSREAWFAVCLSDTDIVLAESQTGDRNHPGVTGVVSFKNDGVPLLLGQVGVEAAIEKVANQQIQNTERINRAPITGPPLLGDTLRWGEYNVIDLSLLQGRTVPVQRHAPDSPGNLMHVMGQFLALAEKFNYNPESNMGQGDANSGKALQQLLAGPRSLITNVLFGPYETAFPRAYDDGMEIELNLWPNERKSATGKRNRESFEVDYTPSAALQGYKGHVSIEEARMGGYNAFLEALQKKDARLISRRSVMEQDPDVRDIEAEIRRMSLEETEEFIQAGFDALGGQDPLTAIRASAELLKKIQGGKSKAEAIQEVIAEGLLEPPAPPEIPGMEAGGLPPELMAALGGGGELPGAPPSLSAARGF